MLVSGLGIRFRSIGGAACTVWLRFGMRGASGVEFGELAGVGGIIPLLIDKDKMVEWSDACSKS